MKADCKARHPVDRALSVPDKDLWPPHFFPEVHSNSQDNTLPVHILCCKIPQMQKTPHLSAIAINNYALGITSPFPRME